MDLPNFNGLKIMPNEPEDQEPEGPPNRIGECRRFPPTFHPTKGPIFPITSDKDRFGRPCGCGHCIPNTGNKPAQDCSICKVWHEITEPNEIAMIYADFEEEIEEEEETEGEAPAPGAEPEPPQAPEAAPENGA